MATNKVTDGDVSNKLGSKSDEEQSHKTNSKLKNKLVECMAISMEMGNIVQNGDLARVREFCQWVDTETDKWSEENKQFHLNDSMKTCIRYSDAAFLQALIAQPQFALFSHAIVNVLHPKKLVDNPIFTDMIRRALLPCIGPEDKTELRKWLCYAIDHKYHSSICEFYESLWSKTLADVSDSNHVKSLYSDILREQKVEITDMSIVQLVIRTGISSNIYAMRTLINDHFNYLDTYTKSKLIEWATRSKFTKSEFPVLERFHNDIEALQKLYEEDKVFTSQISEFESSPSMTAESIIQNIMARLDSYPFDHEANKIQEDIQWLLDEVCKALKKEHYKNNKTNCEALLVGSAAENTQTLFRDEYDYVLLEDGQTSFSGSLPKVITDISMRQHPRLVLDSMYFRNIGAFSNLQIAWMDNGLRHILISIDLVPSVPLLIPVHLPNHNFLPVPRDQHPGAGIPHKPRLYIDYNANIVFSQVENGLIKALPTHVREGYRLAKAIRTTHVIQPVVPELIHLGVTNDIHKMIRSYHLKTCVFFLTQNYVNDEADIGANNRLTWTIAIYEKLRECIMMDDAKEFFATEQYMFRGEQLECKHSKDEVTVDMPRFRCCRRRKARLLMVDQILCVLRDAQNQD